MSESDSSKLEDSMPLEKVCITCHRGFPASSPSAECNDCLDEAERRSDAFFKKLKQEQYDNENKK